MSCSKPRPAASSSGDLHSDAMYEVLLRIPAKELCRLRIVCSAWRALTSDPYFIAAHKSRHRTAPPLLAVGYRNYGGVSGVAISDLSGNVVKRIPCIGGKVVGPLLRNIHRICVVRTQQDLIIFHWGYSGAFLVLNPATGATIGLPMSFSEEFAHELEVKGIKESDCRKQSCAFGQVSSTKEYKALRISRVGNWKVCEVITFDDTNHGSWRRKQDPPSGLCTHNKMRYVVVDGVVYFLIYFYPTYYETGVMNIQSGSVASFNLETEEWMGVLHGPEPVQRFVQENED